MQCSFLLASNRPTFDNTPHRELFLASLAHTSSSFLCDIQGNFAHAGREGFEDSSSLYDADRDVLSEVEVNFEHKKATPVLSA